MGEQNTVDFIHIPSFNEFVMHQDFEQQIALQGFYQAFCKIRYDRSDAHLDGRQGKFPEVLGCIWTIDTTLYALNAAPDAHEDPADYLLMAAKLRGKNVRTEELEVVRVRHVSTDDGRGVDKVIDAMWHETNVRTTMRLGRQPFVLTRYKNGELTYSPSLPIG